MTKNTSFLSRFLTGVIALTAIILPVLWGNAQTTATLYTDGTNFGIGTTGPTQKLQIIGTISATAFSGDGSALTGISAGSSGWTDGGTSVYTTTTTDNVGIGTTTSSTTLEIVKQGSQAPLMISHTATGDGNIIYVSSAGNVGIGTTSPAGGLIIMNGNVGIGTVGPEYPFMISRDAGPANADITPPELVLRKAFSQDWYHPNFIGQLANGTIASPSDVLDGWNLVSLIGEGWANAAYEGFGQITVGVDGTPGFHDAPGKISLYTTPAGTNNWIERMTVRNNGSIGIGTYMSTTGLSVLNGNVGIGTWSPGSGLMIRRGNVGIGTTTPYLRIAAPANGMAVEGSVGIGTWAAANGKLLVMGGNVGIGTATPVGAFTVMNGNVGIGTWSPNAKMDVNGSVRINSPSSYWDLAMASDILTFTPFGSVNTAIQFSDGNLIRAQIGVRSTQPTYFGMVSNVGIGTLSPVGGLTVMNGNVGVGTWSPVQALEVVGTVKASAFVGDGSGLTGISAGGWTDGGTNIYTSTTTDWVGIGTVNPSSPLEVRSTQVNDVTIFRNTNSSGYANTQYVNNSGNAVYVGIGGSGVSDYPDSAYIFSNNTIPISFANASTSRMTIGTAGGVGIGTTLMSTGLSVMNGNIGIGTWSSPANRLSILGNIGIGTTLPYRRISAPNNGMVVEGNVGVGTWNPQAKFQVIGKGAANVAVLINTGDQTTSTDQPVRIMGTNSGSIQYTGLYIENSSSPSVGNKSALQFGFGTYGFTGEIASVLTSPSYGGLSFSTGNTAGFDERMRLNQDGNLGIGTTAPQGALTVMNGNVGIGTWSPTQRLQVVGTVSATAFVGDGSGLTGIAAGSSGWTDGGTNVYTSTTTDTVGVGTTTPNATTFEIVKQGSTAPLKISSTASGSGDYLLMTSSGRMGIGTASPSFQLEMKGAGNTDLYLGTQYINTNSLGFAMSQYVNNAGITGFVGVGGSSGTVPYGNRMSVYSVTGLSLLGGNDIWFYTAANQVAVIDGNGNFGIGTSGPNGGLIVLNGNVGIGTVNPVNRFTVIGNMGIGTTTPYRRITAPSNGMAIEGNVGIGTWAAANGKLIIVGGNVGIGTVAPRGAMSVMNGSVGIGTTNPAYSLDVNGDIHGRDLLALGGSTFGGYNGFIQLFNSSDTTVVNLDSNSASYFNGGNVGVGTTNPRGALTVMSGNVGVGTWSPTARLQVVGTVAATAFVGDGSALTGIAAGNSGWTDGGTNVYTSTTTDNVGIGTTTPGTYKLLVQGTTATNIVGVTDGTATAGIFAEMGNVANQVQLGAVSNHSLGFFTNDATPQFSLNTNGAALIGTYANTNTYGTGPSNGLAVSGSVGVGTDLPVGGLVVMNGNAGIGTWSPQAKLEVIGSVSASAFYGDGSNLTGISAGGWTDGGTNVYTSATTDNVGIGTTTPASTLTIVGNIGIGTITPYRTIAGPRNGIVASGNVGIGTWEAANGKLVVMGGNVAIGTTTPVGAFTVVGGNVGIGTWSPRSNLEIKNTAVFSTEYDNGSQAAGFTVNWNNGNKQKVTVTGSTSHAVTFTAPTGGVANLLLKIVQGDASNTTTWPAAVKWPGASAPTLTSASGSVDIMTCYYDGTNYYCVGSLDLR